MAEIRLVVIIGVHFGRIVLLLLLQVKRLEFLVRVIVRYWQVFLFEALDLLEDLDSLHDVLDLVMSKENIYYS